MTRHSVLSVKNDNLNMKIIAFSAFFLTVLLVSSIALAVEKSIEICTTENRFSSWSCFWKMTFVKQAVIPDGCTFVSGSNLGEGSRCSSISVNSYCSGLNGVCEDLTYNGQPLASVTCYRCQQTSCTPSCSGWGVCASNSQTRLCTRNDCTQYAETQSCGTIPPPSTGYDCVAIGTVTSSYGMEGQVVCDPDIGASELRFNICRNKVWESIPNAYPCANIDTSKCSPSISYNSLQEAQSSGCPSGIDTGCASQLQSCGGLFGKSCCPGLTCTDTQSYGKICQYTQIGGCKSDSECTQNTATQSYRACDNGVCAPAYGCDYQSPKSFVCTKEGNSYFYYCDDAQRLYGKFFINLDDAKKTFCPSQQVYTDKPDGQGTPTQGAELDDCGWLKPCLPGFECQQTTGLRGKVCVYIEAETGLRTGCNSDDECLKNADGSQRQCVNKLCYSGETNGPCNNNDDCVSGFACKGIINKTCQQQTFMEKYGKYLIILLPTALGGLLLYAMKKDIFWGLVGAIIGLIVGLIFYWITNLPWYVKLLGGVGSGALVYFIGPALIAALLPLLFRRR